MRKIFTFLLFALWLPAMMLAAAPSGQVIYVGNETVTSGGYWTTDDSGNVTAYSGEGTPADNFIHYDATNNVLTLHNATIKESVPYDTSSYVMGAIGVFNQSGNAELTIALEGTNTIAEVNTGIYVLASSESTGDASLTITGDGSLNASSSLAGSGIRVQSNGGDATLIINSAEVKAVGTYTNYSGVWVQAQNGSDVSLTVDGGSLTTSGDTGICLLFGFSESGSGTPSLNVSNNAIVRASGNAGGIASNASAATPSGTGIVFNGNDGIVYGDVTLQEDLEISEGESLTIPDGASLTVPDGKTLTVNGGKLTGNVTGTVIYKVTGVSLNKTSLTLNVGGSETLTATITPSNATNKNVTWSSEDANVAMVDTNGKVTAVGAGSTTIKATVDGKSASCEVTVTKATPTVDDFIFTAPEDWTYGDEGKSVTVEAKAGVTGMGEITISYWQEGNQVETPTDAGTYTVKVCVAEGDNYAAAELADETWTFEIKKATLSGELIKAEGETTISLDLETGSTILTAYVEGDGIPTDGTWKWKYDESVVTLKKIPETRSIVSQSSRKVTPVSVGTTTITATYTTTNYTGTVSYTLTVTEPEAPETPVIPDYPEYYNIIVEECEGVTVETSTNVVREGQSMTFTIDITEGYTDENMTVKVKRSLFGYTEVIEPNNEGIYEVKNIYTDIYITVAGVEEEEEETPTGMEDVEGVKVYSKDGSIYVQTSKQEQVQIISISGAVLKNETQVGLQRYDLPRGIYVICIGEERYKVRI